jgi:hypothetical protein
MDPYLESHLWPDVHSALASKIRQLLAPVLRPRYAARLGIYVVEDTAPDTEIGIMYPDIEVLMTQTPTADKGALRNEDAIAQEGTPAVLSVPVVLPIEVAVTNVEIRDTASNRLVACIELLSPVNKREPGISAYRQKRARLYQADVHLIEIDLLRRGARPVAHPRMPDACYLIALTRARAKVTDLWPLSLREPLPVVPVPLTAPDDDVLLPLSQALQEVYDEAAYELSIDYSQNPPPPPLNDDDASWMRQRLRRR